MLYYVFAVGSSLFPLLSGEMMVFMSVFVLCSVGMGFREGDYTMTSLQDSRMEVLALWVQVCLGFPSLMM